MTHAYLVSCVVLLIALVLILIRALLGPTRYDRILAVNSFGTKTVIFLGLLGAFTGRMGYLDIAILYALVNYVGTIVVLKYVRFRRLD